jgi:hypothetical protein
MIKAVETYTSSETGKAVYRKRLADDTIVRIGRGEFMRLWFELTGRTFPDFPKVETPKVTPQICDQN